MEWESFLPKQMRKVIAPIDQAWIAQCLYDSNRNLKTDLPDKNWYEPPELPQLTGSPPDLAQFFRQRMFLWAPMSMWKIPLSCPKCRSTLGQAGMYPKAREVFGMQSTYYLVSSDYPRCGRSHSVHGSTVSWTNWTSATGFASQLF